MRKVRHFWSAHRRFGLPGPRSTVKLPALFLEMTVSFPRGVPINSQPPDNLPDPDREHSPGSDPPRVPSTNDDEAVDASGTPLELDLEEPDGQRAVFEKYSRRLSQLASRHISDQMARRFDDEDILQSTFRSFFRRYDRGEFEIETEQQLWRLLAKMTLCKTRSYARQHTAQKRDIRLNQRLEANAQRRLTGVA